MRIPIREYWRVLSRYLTPDRRLIWILAVILLSGIFVQLLAPWLAARFIDRATTAAGTGDAASHSGVLQELLILAGAFLAAGVLTQVLAVATTHLGSYIAWRATNRLREHALEHCLTLDLSFHHRHSPGVMVERLDGDVRELNNFFAEFALRVIGNIILIIAVLGVIFVVDWRLGLVFAALTAVALFVFNRVRGVAAPHWQRARESSSVLYGELEERFGGIPDIRSSGASGYVLRRFAERLRDNFRSTRRAASISIGVGQAAGLVMGLGGAIILGVAAVLYRADSLSLGTVVAMAMYTAIIAAPLREIIDQIGDLQRASASINRVKELLATEPTIRSGSGANWPNQALSVTFENVTFTYPRDEQADPSPAEGTEVIRSSAALEEVSFSLEPGEVLGLVGRTGAGKSTVVRLLLRFYDPNAGRVLVNGVDLRTATLSELRHHIGVVTQEVQLFEASIRDNLTLFDPEVSDDRLMEVLDEVGLGPWLARQRSGLDTPLAADGTGLSAGEAQLLGVARIFIADPGVVILDEPTSRLDPATERLLDSAFDRLLAERTAIIVAHRLQTLHRADQILMLRDGRVVEYGPRSKLVADPGSELHPMGDQPLGAGRTAAAAGGDSARTRAR